MGNGDDDEVVHQTPWSKALQPFPWSKVDVEDGILLFIGFDFHHFLEIASIGLNRVVYDLPFELITSASTGHSLPLARHRY